MPRITTDSDGYWYADGVKINIGDGTMPYKESTEWLDVHLVHCDGHETLLADGLVQFRFDNGVPYLKSIGGKPITVNMRIDYPNPDEK